MPSIYENEASEQEVRAKLRESFLQAVGELIGQPCNIVTYERSSLTAIFSGLKPDCTEILVRHLKTPAVMEIEAALLRAKDVLAVQFERALELP